MYDQSMKNHYQNIDITIPSKLNISIALIAMSSCLFILYLASHTDSYLHLALLMIGFGYLGNTVFSLLHEAVHANFHHNRKVNYVFGNFLAAFFPTGFTFQKRCHLNHHRNNRTEYELFETYHEGDNKVLRALMFYFVLTGVYWIFPLLGSLWLLINPSSMTGSKLAGKNDYKLGRIGGASMLRDFQNLTKSYVNRMRLEVVFMLLFQLSLFVFLGITFKAWILCYVSFAVLWSSLQYADHAYSPYDIRNGAWNLKVDPLTKAFFLNYHDHLAHHQHPHVSWIHLPKFIDPNFKQPTFLSIYLRMWRGLTKIEKPKKLILDSELEKLIDKENFLT